MSSVFISFHRFLKDAVKLYDPSSFKWTHQMTQHEVTGKEVATSVSTCYTRTHY